MNPLLAKLGIRLPIIQAPMAGTATPAMAAAASNAGALGSLGLGTIDAAAARSAIEQVRAATDRPFNINYFCHRPAKPDAAAAAAWIARLTPEFARYGASPPDRLAEIYTSFVVDTAMQAMLIETAPPVVSFHFGLPGPAVIQALKTAGCVLLASATNLADARIVERAGVDAVVAQGYEAGGHRGLFDENGEDTRLGVLPLTRLLASNLAIPVIAAGGIMDGAGINAALSLGAQAAQLGTAFIACPESSADEGHRAALMSDAANHTVMTRAISGRPARCLANRFTALTARVEDAAVPVYPATYDAGKALNAAAKAKGEPGYGPQWAGQGAPLARSLPTAQLIEVLIAELEAARA
jgi:nitronate monooxygenase